MQMSPSAWVAMLQEAAHGRFAIPRAQTAGGLQSEPSRVTTWQEILGLLDEGRPPAHQGEPLRRPLRAEIGENEIAAIDAMSPPSQ